MAALFLSGGSSGANWLPLLFPLAVLLVILYAVDLTMKFIKKRKLRKENELIDELHSQEDTNAHIIDHPNS